MQINGGAWISLNNTNADLELYSADAAYGGIGGGYATVRLTVPVAASGALTEGDNYLWFYFERPPDERVKSGYRIVDLNFRTNRDTDLRANQASNVLNSNQFEEDNPSDSNAPNWRVIHPGNGVAEGKRYWETAALIDYPGGPTINATCADCHAADGRDLKYFNYSNTSIVERSLFHGLDTLEAEQIASYIRSLNVPAPAQARPWNPPYQPGPGLDDNPTAWAAGAGLDWALAQDEEMLPYLFPGGTNQSAINDRVSIDQTLNIREMPVAIQFPDWNKWLPEVHPKDLLATSYASSALKTAYDRVKSDFTNQDAAARNANNTLVARLTAFSDGIENFLNDPVGVIHPWTETDRNGNSPGLAQRKPGYLAEEFKLNLARWQAVKHWEVMQEFDIESEVPRNRPGAEALQWPSENWIVFQIAPHVIGDVRGGSTMQGQAPAVGYYFSTVWYQVQMTLNAGMRNGNLVETIDWAYNYQHVLKANRYTQFREPLRYFQNIIKGYQQRNTGRPIRSGAEWTLREVSPWRLYSQGDGYQGVHATLDSYEPGLRAKVTNALLREFVDKVNTYSPGDWARADRGRGSWWELEHSYLTPQDLSGGDCLFLIKGRCIDEADADEIDAIYTLLGKLEEMNGIDCGVVSDLARWCKTVWPGNNGANAQYWDPFINSGCDETANDPVSDGGGNAGETVAGTYYLKNKCSGLRMRYTNDVNTNNGTGVELGTASGSGNEYAWNISLVPGTTDRYFISNVGNGLEIRPDNCSQSAGALIETFDGTGNCVQWKFIPVSDDPGYYYLENYNATQSDNVVSMRMRNQGGGNSRSTGTPIETLNNGTGGCMRWELVPLNGARRALTADKVRIEAEATPLIYPNPVSDQLYIGNLSSDDQVKITNMIGRVLYQGTAQSAWEVSHWPEGVYLVQINQKVHRFIKQ